MSEANPYKERLKEYSSVILPFYNENVTEQERSLLDQRVSFFDEICVELGSGSGMHLIELAASNPQRLHIGFELRYKRIFRTAEKATKRNLDNLILLRTRAETLSEYFDEHSVDIVFVNFPDPWEKSRWKKHRLLQKEFFLKLHFTLKKDGVFSFKTDHQEYFKQVKAILDSMPFYTLQKYTLDLHKSEYSSENILSEFEKLFMSKSLPTYFLQVIAQ